MRTYLDHAADTPLRSVAARAWADAPAGNPASVHATGRAARRCVQDAREQVAAVLGAAPSGVVWTSGGTEADNLAVRGLYLARRATDPALHRVVVGAVEHPAVLEPARALGGQVDELPVDGEGTVDLAALAVRLQAGGVALVAVQWANHEIGTLQPVSAVTALAARYGVPVHVDAVAAAGQVPVDLLASGAATLAVSAHKLGGPAGIGAVLARPGTVLAPLLVGGGQEGGTRAGSVPVALVAGFAAALVEAVAQLGTAGPRLAALRDDLVAGALARVDGATLHGPADPGRRLPGTAHLGIDGCSGEDLLYLLDAAGVDVSTGSACHAGVGRPSHVLAAMGVDESTAAALRLTLGHTSTAADVATLLGVLPAAVARARSVRTTAAVTR